MSNKRASTLISNARSAQNKKSPFIFSGSIKKFHGLYLVFDHIALLHGDTCIASNSLGLYWPLPFLVTKSN